MSSVADQILDYAASRGEVITTQDVIGAIDATKATIWQNLGSLVKEGRLVRVKTAHYVLPGVEPLSPTGEQDELETTDDLVQIPAALEMAAWNTGELLLRRDDQTVVLTPSELGELVEFAYRCRLM